MVELDVKPRTYWSVGNEVTIEPSGCTIILIPVWLIDFTEKYNSVYNLVTHADKRPASDFLHRTLMSLFLLRCLQDADFFNNNNKIENKNSKYIGY